MKQLTWFAIGLALTLVFSAGVALPQQVIDEVVAKVNDDIILRSEVDQQRAMMRDDLTARLQGAELNQALSQIDENLLRDLIDQMLLRQKAEERGLSPDLEVIRAMEQMRQEYKFESLEALEAAIVAQGDSVEDFKEAIGTQYMTQQVIQQDVYSRMRVTTEELRSYYDAHVSDFDRPRGVRLQEIVLVKEGLSDAGIAAARERAEQAKSRIDSGEDFASVAAELSDSGTARVGGDLGFVEESSLRDDYRQIASGLSRNQVSELIELPDFFVILKLLDRHDGGILPFELARQEIENTIMNERVQPEIRKYLTELRENSFIEVEDGYADSGADAADSQ